MYRKLLISVFMIAILAAGFGATEARAADEFTLLSAVVGEGGNIWLPSSVIVSKGSDVKLKLRNLADKEHGFSIKELGVEEVVKAGETKEISVKAGKSGVFRYFCHLHAGHVGGQLMVK